MASVGKLGYIHVADDGDGTEYETVEDWAAAVAKHSKGYLGESISIGSRTHRELELSRRRDALFEQSGAYQLFLTTQVPESDEDPVNALVGQVRGTWARCSGGPGQDPCPFGLATFASVRAASDAVATLRGSPLVRGVTTERGLDAAAFF